MRRLVDLQYERNDVNFIRNKFRVRGDTVDIYLAYMSELAIKVEFFGDEIDRITEFNPSPGPNRTSSSTWPSSRPATTSSAPRKRPPPSKRSGPSATSRSSSLPPRAS